MDGNCFTICYKHTQKTKNNLIQNFVPDGWKLFYNLLFVIQWAIQKMDKDASIAA